jgi:hypothetical protein
VIYPKEMSWECGRNGTENKCKDFGEIPAGGRPLWKPKHKLEDNINIEFKEI